MNRVTIGTAMLLGGLLLSHPAVSGPLEEPVSPEEVTTGEVRIHLSSDYAKVLVDGEPWEEAVFENNGTLLIIHLLPRTVGHEISLTPIYPNLGSVQFRIEPSDWRLASINKTEKVWRVEKKISFPKASPQKAPPPSAPAEE